MDPRLLHLIACDDVHCDSANLHRINVYGLVYRIHAKKTKLFPLIHSRLTILMVLVGCVGAHNLFVRITEERTGRVVFRSPTRRIKFVGDADTAHPIVFRVLNCSFPAAGLYWIEAVLSGELIGGQPIIVTA